VHEETLKLVTHPQQRFFHRTTALQHTITVLQPARSERPVNSR